MFCTSSDDALYFFEVSWQYLEGFQVIERTQNYHSLISKGNNSKNVLIRVMVLVICTSSDDALYFDEVS